MYGIVRTGIGARLPGFNTGLANQLVNSATNATHVLQPILIKDGLMMFINCAHVNVIIKRGKKAL